LAFGRALVRLGQSERALGHLQCALALNPAASEPGVELLRTYGKLERWGALMAAAEQLLSRDARCFDAHELLVAALNKQRSFDAAIAAIERARASNVESTLLLEQHAHALRCVGRLPEAMSVHARIIAENPKARVPHSSFLLSTLFHPDYSDERISAEARAWA